MWYPDCHSTGPARYNLYQRNPARACVLNSTARVPVRIRHVGEVENAGSHLLVATKQATAASFQATWFGSDRVLAHPRRRLVARYFALENSRFPAAAKAPEYRVESVHSAAPDDGHARSKPSYLDAIAAVNGHRLPTGRVKDCPRPAAGNSMAIRDRSVLPAPDRKPVAPAVFQP